jgi:hypothetical protein
VGFIRASFFKRFNWVCGWLLRPGVYTHNGVNECNGDVTPINAARSFELPTIRQQYRAESIIEFTALAKNRQRSKSRGSRKKRAKVDEQETADSLSRLHGTVN